MTNIDTQHNERSLARFAGKVIGILLVLGITGQAQQPGSSVLLPESTVPVAPICTGKKEVCKGWKPTKEDIQELDANLSQIAHLKSDWGSGPINHPERYFRQYVAVKIAEQELIYVNAFCISPPADWQQHLHVVLDGGTCFWQAIYNPKTKKFSHLIINGRA